MNDDRFLPTVLIGVEPCGCITAVFTERRDEDAEYRAYRREFYNDMADTGREVRRMLIEEAKKSPHFLDCTHVKASK